MKIYEYENYDEYVAMQSEANKLKLDWVYVRPIPIKTIVKHFVEKRGRGAESVLCHGTRNGAEQKLFKGHFPDAFIVGSEISDTAEQFPMTVQHDFSKVRDEWVGRFDIVYSNAFDHSIKPVETIEVWREQLCECGILYVEYSQLRSESSKYDPLDATNKEVISLLEDCGFGVEIAPGKKKGHLIFMCSRR